MEVKTIQELSLAEKVDQYYQRMDDMVNNIDNRFNGWYQDMGYSRDDQGLWLAVQPIHLLDKLVPSPTYMLYEGRHEDAVSHLLTNGYYFLGGSNSIKDYTNIVLRKVEPISVTKRDNSGGGMGA